MDIPFFETVYGKPAKPGTLAIWPGIDHRLTSATEGTPDAVIAFASAPFDPKQDGASLVATAARSTGAVFVQSVRTAAGIFGTISHLRGFSEGGLTTDGSLAPGRRYTLVRRLFFAEEDWCAHAPDIVLHFASQFAPPLPTETDVPGRVTSPPSRSYFDEGWDGPVGRTDGIAALGNMSAHEQDNIFLSALIKAPQTVLLQSIPRPEQFLDTVSQALRLMPRRSRILGSFAYGLKAGHERVGVVVAEHAGPLQSGENLTRSGWNDLAAAYREAPPETSLVDVLRSSMWRAKVCPYLENGDMGIREVDIPDEDRAELKAMFAIAMWCETKDEVVERAFEAVVGIPPVGVDDDLAEHVRALDPETGEDVLRRHRIFFSGDFGNGDFALHGFVDVDPLARMLERYGPEHSDAIATNQLMLYFAIQGVAAMDGFLLSVEEGQNPDPDFPNVGAQLVSILSDYFGIRPKEYRRRSVLDADPVAYFGALTARFRVIWFYLRATSTKTAEVARHWEVLQKLSDVLKASLTQEDYLGAYTRGWHDLLESTMKSDDPVEIAFWKDRFEVILQKAHAEKPTSKTLRTKIRSKRNRILAARQGNGIVELFRDFILRTEEAGLKKIADLPPGERALNALAGAVGDEVQQDQEPAPTPEERYPTYVRQLSQAERQEEHIPPPKQSMTQQLDQDDLQKLSALIERIGQPIGVSEREQWFGEAFQMIMQKDPARTVPDGMNSELAGWINEAVKGSVPLQLKALSDQIHLLVENNYDPKGTSRAVHFLADLKETDTADTNEAAARFMLVFAWRLWRVKNQPFGLLNPMIGNQGPLIAGLVEKCRDIAAQLGEYPDQSMAIKSMGRRLESVQAFKGL